MTDQEKIAALEAERDQAIRHRDEDCKRLDVVSLERDALAALVSRARSRILDLLDPVSLDSPKSHMEFLKEIESHPSVGRARLQAEVIQRLKSTFDAKTANEAIEEEKQLKDALARLTAHDAQERV